MGAINHGTTSASRASITRARQTRGNIEILPSGSLRVRVYAGRDPITRRAHYLRETIPSGPDSLAAAEATCQRLITQVREHRHPRANATVAHLVDQHTATVRVGVHTRASYRGYLHNHIQPLIGHLRLDALTPEILDAFYTELARCRTHCDTPTIHTPNNSTTTTTDPPPSPRNHDHDCLPLSAVTIRKIHYVLSGAYRKAQRWQWIHTNPTQLADPPPKPAPDPQPPTPTEVTRILTHAWPHPDLAVLLWLAVITGARQGELCALRWTHFHPDQNVLHIRRNIAEHGAHREDKDTKLHQRRHITLDPATTNLLSAYHRHRELRAHNHQLTLPVDGYIFSPDPDGTRCPSPNTLGRQYRTLVTHLGITTTLHKLRHYSATELILAHVDIRTVASRLGHATTTTTLDYYTAWTSEADQRASTHLINRIPIRLTSAGATRQRPLPQPEPRPRTLYQKIADDLRDAISHGTYPADSPLPTQHQLATHYHASTGTIHRAITQLTHEHLIDVHRGQRATALPTPPPIHPATTPTPTIPFPTIKPTPATPHPTRHIHRRHSAHARPRPHVAGQPHRSPPPTP
jgi:integrase